MNLTQQTKSPDNLSEALAECKVFAKRGHILANDAVSLLNRVVNNVSEKLQNEIMNLQVSNYNDNATTGSLASQLSLIRSMSRNIDDVINSVFTLSKTQREFAIALNNKLKEINTAVIKEALAYLGYEGLEWHITSIARIPGYAVMLVLEYGKVFPNDAAKALSDLLKEKVWYVIKNDNIKSMLLQSIWRKVDRNSIDIQSISIQYIDDVPRIAHIPFLDAVDANTQNRIRMAQQITELLIMK